MRDSLVFSGKYGSLTPVTGFCSIVGAMAANSGRGRSLKKTVTIITGLFTGFVWFTDWSVTLVFALLFTLFTL